MTDRMKNIKHHWGEKMSEIMCRTVRMDFGNLPREPTPSKLESGGSSFVRDKVVQHRSTVVKLAWLREQSVKRVCSAFQQSGPSPRLKWREQRSLSLCTAGNDTQCNIHGQASLLIKAFLWWDSFSALDCKTWWQTIVTSDAHFAFLSCPNFKTIVSKFKNAQCSNLSSFVLFFLFSSIHFEMLRWPQIDASKISVKGESEHNSDISASFKI